MPVPSVERPALRVDLKKTQETQGRLACCGSAACLAQASQHSAADFVLCSAPHTTACPPVSEWGSSPHMGGVVTPG
eukprot:CAMPEP_0183369714 /NCGR_PEP_ID=MMETSP0164_2-20130417/100270_1 /TAXON_ID=221442 /ORGANISM="Coccolithus pelagicus ssp braarudi, Strain PLY182g" /LENGTH=75 /DNA_ID=CAMNT_0025546007 /DNA_START=628 /DNA_END=852 /DNA_ORIENTATION=+